MFKVRRLPPPDPMTPKVSTRTPMATILVSLVAGLSLARHFEIASYILLSLALGGGIIALLTSHKNAPELLWTFVFIVSATLCFWAYGNIRLTPKPTAFDLEMPQREAQLTLRVQTVLRSSNRYQSANVIARALHVPEIGRLLEGDLVYAQLRIPKQSVLAKHPAVLLQKGLEIRTTGRLIPIPETSGTEPGNDFDRYLKNIGVHYRLNCTHEPEPVKLPSTFAQFCASMNQRFQAILQMGAPEDSVLANIYVTMLLGNNAALNSEQRERYRMTGTMHFFAISGLHIGVIATAIAQCLLLLRIPRSFGPWIGLPLLFLYVEITGASSSAVRAFLMTAFFWSGFAFSRQHTSFAALVNSALAVLLIDPGQLWNLGFQLSYMVVASILLLGLPTSLRLKQSCRPYQWLPEEDLKTHQRMISWSLNKVIPLFAISFSAWLGSAPLCATFFNLITPGAIVFNMLLVCLVAIAIVSGMLSIGFAVLLLSPVSEFINHAAWLVISVMDGIVSLGALVPRIDLQNGASLSKLSYATLFAYFSSLIWLHRNPERMQTHQIWFPVIILLIGMGLILLFQVLPGFQASV